MRRRDASARGGTASTMHMAQRACQNRPLVISQAGKVLGCVSLKSTRVLPVFKGALVVMRAPVLQQFAKDPSDGSLDC